MTTLIDQGDVLLFQTDNDGDINSVNGILELSGGLETAAYLSLFGGNEDDAGLTDGTLQWWGNIDESDINKKYRSQTQYLLRSIPSTSNNLLRIEDAVNLDLNWLINVGAASEITVNAQLVGLNRIKITVSINAFGNVSDFEYFENWKAST